MKSWCPKCQSWEEIRKEKYIGVKDSYISTFCLKCNTLLSLEYPKHKKEGDK